MRLTGAALLVLLAITVSPASAAANKEHLQLMAEIRMLQEHRGQRTDPAREDGRDQRPDFDDVAGARGTAPDDCVAAGPSAGCRRAAAGRDRTGAGLANPAAATRRGGAPARGVAAADVPD